MTAFDVELAALPAAKTQTDAVHDRLQTALGDVTARVTALLGSGWTGPASRSYQQAFQDWTEGAGEVLQALSAMSELLTVTEQAYAAGDASSREIMDRIGGRLS